MLENTMKVKTQFHCLTNINAGRYNIDVQTCECLEKNIEYIPVLNSSFHNLQLQFLFYADTEWPFCWSFLNSKKHIAFSSCLQRSKLYRVVCLLWPNCLWPRINSFNNGMHNAYQAAKSFFYVVFPTDLAPDSSNKADMFNHLHEFGGNV